jgi:hypothetical protein
MRASPQVGASVVDDVARIRAVAAELDGSNVLMADANTGCECRGGPVAAGAHTHCLRGLAASGPLAAQSSGERSPIISCGVLWRQG